MNFQTPIIRLTDIVKIYGSGEVAVQALKGIDFEIKRGEYLSIIGMSGSGKSTLLNILGCLDTATSGLYELDGVSTQELSNQERAVIRNQKIGFVFQTYNLLPRVTALDNVELPMIYNGIQVKKRRQKARDMLKKVGLGDRMDHHPNQLSGGQKQRVAIARALMNDPAIILADEPTGNLDSVSSAEIMGIFDQLHKEGKTILMVTHEQDIAAHTKRTIQMRDGMIIEDSPVVHGKI